MNWGLEDFVMAGLMLSAVAGCFLLARRQSSGLAYLLAFAIMLGALFVTVFAWLAVGIIGSEDHPANLLYTGVIAVCAMGAARARLRPAGMSRTLALAAGLQAGVTVLGAVLMASEFTGAGFFTPLAFNVLLTGSLALSAWLFRLQDGLEARA